MSVGTKCAKTRSLSVHSPLQTKSITKRLCNSAIMENRRSRCLDPDEWTTTKTPNLILNKPSVSTLQNQKRNSIRESLLLKSKIDISINDSLDISSPLIDFNSFTSFDDDQTAITPSSTSVVQKGVKGNRETISDTSMKACKTPRYNSVEPAEEKSFSEPGRSQRKRSYNPYGFDLSEYDISGIMSLLSTPNETGKKSTPSFTKITLNDLSNNKLLDASQTRIILYSSPLNDLSDVEVVETFFKTPSIKKTPKSAKKKLNAQNYLTDVNDLRTKIGSVKKLFKTPGEKSNKSPLNDLTNVQGVKTLFKTPRENKSPLNDLTVVCGVKRMLKTPKPIKSLKNDLTNAAGVKKMSAIQKRYLNLELPTTVPNESPLVQVSSGRATRNKRKILEMQDAVKTEIKTRRRRGKVNDDDESERSEQAKTTKVNNEESAVVKMTRSRAKKPKNNEEEAMDVRDENVNADNESVRAEPQAKATKSRKRVNNTTNADAESLIRKTRSQVKNQTKNTEEKKSAGEERKPRTRKNLAFDVGEKKPEEKKSRTKKNQTSAEEAIEVPEKKKRAKKNVKTCVDDEEKSNNKEENVEAIEEPRYNTRLRKRT